MKDSIVESVRQDLLDRSELGIKKYNTTLDREDLATIDWVRHAYEENLDSALYLKKLHKILTETSPWSEFIIAKEKNEYLLKENSSLDDINADLNAELHIKNKIIENLTKVIKSQEEEIAELKKEEYFNRKRRAWHY